AALVDLLQARDHPQHGGLATGDLTPTLRWKFQDTLASIGLPRLVNANVTLQQVRNGRLTTAADGFTDVTSTLKEAAL
ncbi:hypothetical protein ABZ476_24005, partial [Streptomyces albogriseolus]